ncbi:MAG: DNA recombination protein RmuC [Alphaproteobacteria bacterium]|nr:DNA recombination protein RmuC [Alphaproteobacteria bacterium]
MAGTPVMREFLTYFLPFLLGLGLGGAVAWLAARTHSRADGQWADRFENLANRIFEEKTARFRQDSQDGISQLLSPLRERLQDFQKKVDESFGHQAKEQFSLKKEIERIVAVNEKMTLQTEGLSKALKGDAKAQGNWGEVMLEKILEESGLRKGKDYIVQGTELGLRHAEDGRALKPDIIIMLPDDKHIIVDSKVSLTAYAKYCEAEDAQRQMHLKDCLASLRSHVDGLEQRRYQDAGKLGTPDFVLMFVPVEGAYALAVQQDTKLHNYAWDKKIVMVCPSTLFATLRTIASVWKMEMQNQNAMEIARRGGALYDKVAGFVDDMQKLGKQLDGASTSFANAMNKLSGRGGVLRQTETMKALGAKASKKLPIELLGVETEAEIISLSPEPSANEDAA